MMENNIEFSAMQKQKNDDRGRQRKPEKKKKKKMPIFFTEISLRKDEEKNSVAQNSKTKQM